MSEEQLIRRAQQGDNGAFEELLLLHQKKVYNLCLRMSANPDDALDLSQEAFLRAWRSLGQYQFEASFSTWLFRLTSNICIDFLRRKKRRQETSLTESYDDSDEGAELSVPDAQPGPEQQAMTNETAAAASRIRIIGSFSSSKNRCRLLFFFPAASRFGPCSESRRAASASESPCSVVCNSSRIFELFSRYSFIPIRPFF